MTSTYNVIPTLSFDLIETSIEQFLLESLSVFDDNLAVILKEFHISCLAN